MVRTLVLALPLLVLFPGCRSQERTGPYLLRASPDKPTPKQYTEPIIALDENITKGVYYVDHDQERLPSGNVRIVVRLQNRHVKDGVWVKYKRNKWIKISSKKYVKFISSGDLNGDNKDDIVISLNSGVWWWNHKKVL